MATNMHGVQLEPRARQLIENDRRMRETAVELAAKTIETARMMAGLKDAARSPEIRQRMGEMRVLAEFLRTLQGRRETTIFEMAREGISEADVYRAMERGVDGRAS